jgi:Helix-turn-helix domain
LSRAAYLRHQQAGNPDYERDRRVARAHLDLAAEIHRWRVAFGYDVAALASRAALPPERLEMIEEGDTTSLTEILRLCDALGVSLQVASDLTVKLTPSDLRDQPLPAAVVR